MSTFKWLFLFLYLAPAGLLPAFSQTDRIDSLKGEVSKANGLRPQLNAVLVLCEQAPSMNVDTLYHYAFLARQMARLVSDERSAILADVYIEKWLERRNLLDSALHMCNRDLTRVTAAGDGKLYALLNMEKCFIIMKSGQHKEAQDYAYRFLNEAETLNDTVSQIYCQYIIGNVYRNMQQTEPALQWFRRAAATGAGYEDKKNGFGLYLLMGMMYNWKADADLSPKDYALDSAQEIYYLDKAIALSRKYGDAWILARSLCTKADGIEDAAHMAEAGGYLKEALQIYDQLHDTLSILNGITAMSNYYISANQPGKGIAACKKGIEMVKRGNSFPLIDMYWTLAQCYKAAGNNGKYAETLNTIISLKDTVYRKNSEKELADLNAKYEVQKKENIIIAQRLDIASKRNTLLGASILSVLLLGSIFILSTYFRKRQKELRQRQAIEVAKAEEAERRRISADLHDNIGAYATAISANVDEILLHPSSITGESLAHLKDSATEIMGSLRDMIWVLNKESVSLTGIGDRVKMYVQKLQPGYRRVAISVEEDITRNILFSPLQALHIFRILQEALNNALKHGNGDTVTIYFKDHPSLVIRVEDNGKGFDASSDPNGGNGLKNMQERAREAGLILDFERAFPRGTAVSIYAAGTPNPSGDNPGPPGDPPGQFFPRPI